MAKATSPPAGPGQIITGLALTGFALTAGSISLAVNALYGLEKSTVHGVVFALSDAVKVTLPIIALGLGGWTRPRRALWAACVVFSIWTALNYFGETDGQKIAASAQIELRQNQARENIARAETALAAISEQDSAEALAALAASSAAKARREAVSGRGPRYEKALAERNEYQARASRARLRDKLEAKLQAAQTVLASAPKITIGAADNMASIFGQDKQWIARLDSLIRTVAIIAMLEAIAALGGLGAAKLAPLANKPTRKQPVDLASTDESAVFMRLKMLILSTEKQEILRSQRELAEILKVPRSTLNGWLKKWNSAKIIDMQTRGGKTLIRLRKAA